MAYGPLKAACRTSAWHCSRKLKYIYRSQNCMCDGEQRGTKKTYIFPSLLYETMSAIYWPGDRYQAGFNLQIDF